MLVIDNILYTITIRNDGTYYCFAQTDRNQHKLKISIAIQMKENKQFELYIASLL